MQMLVFYFVNFILCFLETKCWLSCPEWPWQRETFCCIFYYCMESSSFRPFFVCLIDAIICFLCSSCVSRMVLATDYNIMQPWEETVYVFCIHICIISSVLINWLIQNSFSFFLYPITLNSLQVLLEDLL